MASDSQHVAVHIDRPANEVYDYVRHPAHLADWAHGLGTSPNEIDGRWFADTSGGRIEVAFAPRNEYGVADHDITLPDGTSLHVHLRVLTEGHGCEVVFTARRLAGMTDSDFARDVAAVTTDLATLRDVLESRQG